jgi:hypothetical protein
VSIRGFSHSQQLIRLGDKGKKWSASWSTCRKVLEIQLTAYFRSCVDGARNGLVLVELSSWSVVRLVSATRRLSTSTTPSDTPNKRRGNQLVSNVMLCYGWTGKVVVSGNRREGNMPTVCGFLKQWKLYEYETACFYLSIGKKKGDGHGDDLWRYSAPLA